MCAVSLCMFMLDKINRLNSGGREGGFSADTGLGVKEGDGQKSLKTTALKQKIFFVNFW